MEKNYRRTIIKLFTFLGGIYFFLEFILPNEIGTFKFGKYHEQISNGFIAVGAVAVGLGIINILMIHGARILFKRKGFTNSMALLGGLFFMMFITFKDWIETTDISKSTQRLSNLSLFSQVIAKDYKEKKTGVKPVPERELILLDAIANELVLTKKETELSQSTETNVSLTNAHQDLLEILASLETKIIELRGTIGTIPESLEAVNGALSEQLSALAVMKQKVLNLVYETSSTKHLYSLLFDGLFVSLGSAMFSLLGFYIAAAAYRAFRIRSWESALMMTAAFLVMLGQIPFGLWISESMPEVRLWLLQIPSAGAFRAIKFGAAIALLSMATRMWLSIESESFIGGKKES